MTLFRAFSTAFLYALPFFSNEKGKREIIQKIVKFNIFILESFIQIDTVDIQKKTMDIQNYSSVSPELHTVTIIISSIYLSIYIPLAGSNVIKQ